MGKLINNKLKIVFAIIIKMMYNMKGTYTNNKIINNYLLLINFQYMFDVVINII